MKNIKEKFKQGSGMQVPENLHNSNDSLFDSDPVKKSLENPDMNRVVSRYDIVLITLDTLRYDVAQEQWRQGNLPTLAKYLGARGWQKRHSPGSFTYAAHQAFFAGFLPTPATPGPPREQGRLFAMDFPGSATADSRTKVFAGPDLVQGLEAEGYHTICVGGVGFFNKLTPLGRALPDLFVESHWAPEYGVTDPDSTANQINCIRRSLEGLGGAEGADPARRVFLFLNVAALHQPNRFYLSPENRPDTAGEDSLASHAAALRYVDTELAKLFALLEQRGPTFVIICSDHGTAYGDDGFHGHRLAHESVWTIPYTHFFLGEER